MAIQPGVQPRMHVRRRQSWRALTFRPSATLEARQLVQKPRAVRISTILSHHTLVRELTMRTFTQLVGLALLAHQAQALYFYIDGPSQKCFFEELPKDTLVVGMQASSPSAWNASVGADTNV